MKKYILIFILILTANLFAQTIQSHHSALLKKRGAVVAGNYIPDVIYADTAITASAGSTVLTFTHYGSIQANQLMTVWLVKEKAGASEQWTTSAISESGWTRAFQVTNTATHDVAIAMFYKLAVGTESGNFTATATESDEQSGFYIVFDSVDTSNPIDEIGDTTDWSGTPIVTNKTIEQDTTNVDNCLAIAWWGMYNSANFGDGTDTMKVTGTGWAMSPTAGISTGLVTDRVSAFTAGGMMAMKDILTAGLTGSPTFYFGYNTASGGLGRIVAIRGKND